jgi:predicted  nucleic acid-binding Zn-ribbon protein
MKIILTVLLFAGLAVAQTPQKPNGLELRKARDIQSELTRAQAALPGAAKALTQAQAAVTKAQATVTANKDAKKTKALQSELEAAQQRLKEAQTRADQATKRVPQLQAQQTDWENKTLHTHKADDGKHKVDWTAGAIVPR